jgi:polyhydroxyalkanoate synthesis regulator phasin
VSAGASADGLVPMAEPASDDGRSVLELLERLALAGVGAVALTAERIDQLADELAERGGLKREEARATITDLATRWRGDSVRWGERAGAGLSGAFRELGLVTRDEWDELELRVAQLEHRLRLVEAGPAELPRTAHE